jgi:hypothetical protein
VPKSDSQLRNELPLGRSECSQQLVELLSATLPHCQRESCLWRELTRNPFNYEIPNFLHYPDFAQLGHYVLVRVKVILCANMNELSQMKNLLLKHWQKYWVGIGALAKTLQMLI